MIQLTEPHKIVLGLVISSSSALGYGLLAARFLRSDKNPPHNTLAGDGVIGMAILTTLFMVTHFFVPLQQTANLMVLLPGIAGLIFFQRRFLIELPILALTLWWAFQFTRSGFLAWDHGLYHLQSTLWNILEPAIAGLANLQTRMGFDSSVFVLGAGLNIPMYGGWHLALVAPTLIEGMIAADLLFSIRAASDRIARLYALVAVAVLIFEPRSLLLLSYLSPDPVVAMGIVYVVFLFLEKRQTSLLLCVPYMITVKLAAAPMLLLLDWKRIPQKYRAPAVAGGIILLVWITRNVVLSGYLLFPVTATGLPLPWTVPADLTTETADWITSWARTPGKGLEGTRGFTWIYSWLGRNFMVEQARQSMGIFCAGLVLMALTRSFRQLNWRLIGTLGVALLFWFISAPDVRFGDGFLFATAFLSLAYGLDKISLLRLEPANTWIVALALLLLLGWSAEQQTAGEWPQLERPKRRLALTATGDRIWAPTPPDDRCWSMIPCSPEPDKIHYYPERALRRAPALLDELK